MASPGSRLLDWLDLLGQSRVRIVVVPGGGPFAEAARTMQRHWPFDDPTAHHLGLLAMEQYGRALAGLHPGLRPAGSRTAIRHTLQRGETPVWMPIRTVLSRPDIPASWDVTADTLALWLAGEIKAAGLCLIKSAPIPQGTVSASQLAADGLIDAAFPRFLGRNPSKTWILGPDDLPRLRDALQGRGAPGTRITA